MISTAEILARHGEIDKHTELEKVFVHHTEGAADQEQQERR